MKWCPRPAQPLSKREEIIQGICLRRVEGDRVHRALGRDIYILVLQLSSNLILHLLISVIVQIKGLHPDFLTERHPIFFKQPSDSLERSLSFGITLSRRQWHQLRTLGSHLSLRSHQLHLPVALHPRLSRSPLGSTISRD